MRARFVRVAQDGGARGPKAVAGSGQGDGVDSGTCGCYPRREGAGLSPAQGLLARGNEQCDRAEIGRGAGRGRADCEGAGLRLLQSSGLAYDLMNPMPSGSARVSGAPLDPAQGGDAPGKRRDLGLAVQGAKLQVVDALLPRLQDDQLAALAGVEPASRAVS
jgi:hypothetical protein